LFISPQCYAYAYTASTARASNQPIKSSGVVIGVRQPSLICDRDVVTTTGRYFMIKQGCFVGISVEGRLLTVRRGVNERFYGMQVHHRAHQIRTDVSYVKSYTLACLL
jgi:Las17-binding protein actin regulator